MAAAASAGRWWWWWWWIDAEIIYSGCLCVEMCCLQCHQTFYVLCYITVHHVVRLC